MEARAAVQEKARRPREVGGTDLGGLLLGNCPSPSRVGDGPGSMMLPFFVVQQKSLSTVGSPVLDAEIPHWNPVAPRLRCLQAGRGWDQGSVH